MKKRERQTSIGAGCGSEKDRAFNVWMQKEIEQDRALDALREEIEVQKKAKASGSAINCDALISKLENLARLVWPLPPAQEALLKSKIYPLIEQDMTFFDAKLAAQDLKFWHKNILAVAKVNNKRFFIYLGKFLSKEINAEIFDPIDLALARVIDRNPSIKAKDAVRELEKQGWKMTEEAFRMRKKRLGLSRSLRRCDTDFGVMASRAKT
jgi:hypothetical protein